MPLRHAAQEGRRAWRNARALKKRFDAFVRELAFWGGWAGIGLCLLCGLLWLLPESSWDGVLGLTAGSLPVYTVLALALAALAGWRFVNAGQDRITRRVGRNVGRVAFVALPLACLAIGWFLEPVSRWTGFEPPSHPFWIVVRWYPPVAALVCAAVFLAWKSRPRRNVLWDRGLWYALLLLPYALLFATLELGLHVDWFEAQHRETVRSLGSHAIILQLLLAYFVGGD